MAPGSGRERMKAEQAGARTRRRSMEGRVPTVRAADPTKALHPKWVTREKGLGQEVPVLMGVAMERAQAAQTDLVDRVGTDSICRPGCRPHVSPCRAERSGRRERLRHHDQDRTRSAERGKQGLDDAAAGPAPRP
jgi:hypothetical protein